MRWNTYTTFEELSHGYATYPPIPVQPRSIMLVQQMMANETTVSTCVARIMDALDVAATNFDFHQQQAPLGAASAGEEEAPLPADDKQIADELLDAAFQQKIPAQANRAMLHLQMYGYVVFKAAQGEVNRGRDAVPVPVVQDPSTYNAFVCITDDGEPIVVALPKNAPGNAVPGLPSVSGRVQPLQTFVSAAPETVTGRLMSPLASLLSQWTELLCTQVARVRAISAGAIPVQVFQHLEPKTNGNARPVETQFAGRVSAYTHISHETEDSIIADNPETVLRDREDALRASAAAAQSAVAAAVTPFEHFLSNPEQIFGAGVVMRAPPGDASITVPPGMQYAGTVAPPHAPTDANVELQTYKVSVAARMGVPLGLLGLSSSSRAASSVAEHEMQWFVTNMAQNASMLSRTLEYMFEYATGRAVHVQIPLRVPLEINTLFSMYEAMLLDRKQLMRQVDRSYGITRGVDLPFTARNAAGPVVRRSAFGTQATRLQRAPADVAPAVFNTKRPHTAPRAPLPAAGGGGGGARPPASARVLDDRPRKRRVGWGVWASTSAAAAGDGEGEEEEEQEEEEEEEHQKDDAVEYDGSYLPGRLAWRG